MALNEHASVLHYTKLDHQPPAELLSFLIDAGAEYGDYAADSLAPTRRKAAASLPIW